MISNLIGAILLINQIDNMATLKTNVAVRIKPLSNHERSQEKDHLWIQPDGNTIINIRTGEMFSFDNVF